MTIGTVETSNENFVLFGVPGSPYVRSAAVGLEEKGARFTIIALRPFEAKSSGYLKRHAFGRVPLLSHGKFELYETQAILRYLDRIIPDAPLHPA
jgi:glutathione S-transferase